MPYPFAQEPPPVSNVPERPLLESVHRPVLLDAVREWLAPAAGMILVDGTVGAGGHTAALAPMVLPGGRVLALDRDPRMLDLAAARLAHLPVELIHAPYSQIGDELQKRQIEQADRILLDLGFSSDQLAWTDRGFSFARDDLLDMRFDPDEPIDTAADLVNSLDERQLADIFYQFGEERYARRIARALVWSREHDGPIQTTGRLAEIVRRSVRGPRSRIDPATRVFQALRIAVNDELAHLDRFLAHVADWLAPGGRGAIISFHSLEDRRVKQAFRDQPALNVLTRKPITASEAEIQSNPRSRSAKLRVAERWKRPKDGTRPGTNPTR
ncbi:MAG: ribosomal RNA small subunit methyltransferase H [Isosphaeraceae bacterium]|nr:MAG: ribosomal RNA small subunit methyltransferase H [Isosphaeraceae bacterium]